MTDDCLFCRIVAGQITADVVRRDHGMLAFRDIAPKAPVHVLVIPERHVGSIAAVGGLTPDEQVRMLGFVVEVAEQEGIAHSGYRVTTNHGPDALQSVFHLHWHVMGGTRLSDSM